MPKYFTAIIVNKVPGVNTLQFVKYHNIPESKISKLCRHTLKTFQGVDHINLYEKFTKRFYKQLKRQEIESA